jgi:hypothetical protein
MSEMKGDMFRREGEFDAADKGRFDVDSSVNCAVEGDLGEGGEGDVESSFCFDGTNTGCTHRSVLLNGL